MHVKGRKSHNKQFLKLHESVPNTWLSAITWIEEDACPALLCSKVVERASIASFLSDSRASGLRAFSEFGLRSRTNYEVCR